MRTALWLPVLVLLAASGCESRERSESAAPVQSAVVPAPDAAAAGVPDPVTAAPAVVPARRLVVHKSPACGCCLAWADQMRGAGFDVQIRDVEDLTPIKARLGVPAQSASCHTAEIDGYFVEGHVPAEDIERLLAERPEAKGLAVPGMPLGSPGMEVPSGAIQPYEVLLVHDDGSTEVFAQHGD